MVTQARQAWFDEAAALLLRDAPAHIQEALGSSLQEVGDDVLGHLRPDQFGQLECDFENQSDPIETPAKYDPETQI